MGARMAAELQVVESPTVVVVPSPKRGGETPARMGGRYCLELRPADGPLACGHQSPRALLWLIFLEGDEESAREVAEVICAGCDPGRFARAQLWAEALAG